MTPRHTTATPQNSTSNGLDRLVAVEELIAESARAARDEAAAIVEHARTRATAARAGLHAEIAERLKVEAAQVRDDHAARIAALEADRDRRLAALAAVEGSHLDELVQRVLTRLLRGETGEP
jgi:hypothetical protein